VEGTWELGRKALSLSLEPSEAPPDSSGEALLAAPPGEELGAMAWSSAGETYGKTRVEPGASFRPFVGSETRAGLGGVGGGEVSSGNWVRHVEVKTYATERLPLFADPEARINQLGRF